MTRSISLPLHMARTAAQAILPHVSKDDVTPVLAHAAIFGDTLAASDRYSVGTYSIASAPEPQRDTREHEDWKVTGEVRRAGDWDAEPFGIPRAALYRMTTIGTQSLLPKNMTHHHCRVTLAEEHDEASKRHVLWLGLEDDGTCVYRQAFAMWHPLRFPPFLSLIEGWEPDDSGTARFGLMPFNLAKITRFAGSHEPIEVTAGKASKPGFGPMKVAIGERFVGLIQPNLIP